MDCSDCGAVDDGVIPDRRVMSWASVAPVLRRRLMNSASGMMGSRFFTWRTMAADNSRIWSAVISRESFQ